ncbi:Aspartyl/asparaginyl-tRNA synthetase, partial [mine drainage metagenome]
PVFRAEPSDTVRHLTEIGMLDAEMAYIDGAEDLRGMLEEVVRAALGSVRRSLTEAENPLADGLPELAAPFPRIPFETAEAWLGRPGAERDFGTEDEKAIGARVEREYGTPFYYLTDFPTAVKEKTFYARRQDENPARTSYFDLEFRGLEIASGGPREHRIDRLLENLHRGGFDPAAFPGYLEAFRFGMPPTAAGGSGSTVWSRRSPGSRTSGRHAYFPGTATGSTRSGRRC